MPPMPPPGGAPAAPLGSGLSATMPSVVIKSPATPSRPVKHPDVFQIDDAGTGGLTDVHIAYRWISFGSPRR
jgi:hypothetical protein